MAAPRMTQEDVGALYTREDGSVWTLIGYASSPTATLERLYQAREVRGVGSILSEDVRIVAQALLNHVPTDAYYGANGAAVAFDRIRSVLADFRDPPERVDGVAGAPIFDGFTRLVLDGGNVERVEAARCVYPGCPVSSGALLDVGYLNPEPGVEQRVLACRDHLEWVRNEAGAHIFFNSGSGREHV